MEALSSAYARYLGARGFTSAPNDIRAYSYRSFVESFQQPGFHLFWQLWNPIFGFALYRMYLALGGRRRRVLSTLVVFVSSGFLLHDVPVGLLVGRPLLVCTVAWAFFGVAVLVSPAASTALQMKRWPRWGLALFNAGTVLVGMAVGVAGSRSLLG